MKKTRILKFILDGSVSPDVDNLTNAHNVFKEEIKAKGYVINQDVKVKIKKRTTEKRILEIAKTEKDFNHYLKMRKDGEEFIVFIYSCEEK